MAINYIGSAISDNDTIDLTGISMQPDDIVIIISGEDVGAPALATGYTSIAVTSSEGDIRYMYKIMPNPVDSSATGLTNASDCGHLAMVFRGVDTSNPIDTFATATGSPTFFGTNGDPNSPSITTTVDGAMIVSMGFLDDDLISTPTPPSGFTLANHNTFGSSELGGSVMGAYFLQTNAGAIDPGGWDTSGSDWWGAISIALTPLENSYTGNYTATYSKDYNLSYIATSITGKFKVWNGSSWQVKPVKVWNGSSWQVKPVKRWNGTAWIDINVADLEAAYVADASYDRGYVKIYTGTDTVFYGGYTGTVTANYSNTFTTSYTGNAVTYSRDTYPGIIFYGGFDGFGGSTGILNYTGAGGGTFGPVYTGLAIYNLSYTADYSGITYDSPSYSGAYTGA